MRFPSSPTFGDLTQAIASSSLLVRRIEKLLFSGAHARQEVKPVLDAIGPLGRVAVFGGVLRDLSFAPVDDFSSDIDLVIDTDAVADLDNRLRGMSYARSRYGGYRIQSGRWLIDVWTLASTWAFRNGLVPDPSFERLVETTFFNWDAIAYEIDSRKLHHIPTYFEMLERRVLEINLEPNANPNGNVVRAIDAVLTRRARLGPNLAEYAVAQLLGAEFNGEEKYAEFFSSPAVTKLVESIREHVARSRDQVFDASVVFGTREDRTT